MLLNVEKIIEKKIKKFLISSMKYKNIHELPKLDAIKINTNLGIELDKNEKLISTSVNVLENITLQKPKIIQAKKSISNFKLKEGDKIALICTLRSKKVNLFVTKLIFFTFPQIESWKIGDKFSKFDKQYNFSFGIDEHLIFPEIGFSFNLKPFGLNINFRFKKQKKNQIDRLIFLKMLKIV